MKINITDRFLIKSDQIADYIPVVSTISNFTDIFEKYVILPSKHQTEISGNRYYKHVQQKSIFRCIALLVPVLGNIFVGLYDLINRKHNDANYILKAVKNGNLNALSHANSQLKNNKNFMLKAVKIDPWALAYASEELRNDEDIVLAALQTPTTLIWSAGKGSLYNSVGKDLLNKKNIVLAGVKQNVAVLRLVSLENQNDDEVVNEAVKHNPDSARYANIRFRNNKEFMLPIIKTNPWMIEHAGTDVKNDPDVLMIIAQQIIFAKDSGGGKWDTLISASETRGNLLEHLELPGLQYLSQVIANSQVEHKNSILSDINKCIRTKSQLKPT